MLTRKLASIQKIKSLEPIPNADAIEKATVLGWQLVVKKGEFQVGDYCVYCEIDSQLPERSEFEFLRPLKFRIKTVRMRGQISQGICFPLSILPPGIPVEEDTDVTEILGIIKYEPPIPVHFKGQVKGGFPGFIPKTDEIRVQVLENVINRYRGKVFYISEKIDGTSMTCYIRDGEFNVCSRSLNLKETPENVYWRCARALDLETRIRSFGRNIAIQGEVAGEGIQKNRLKLKGLNYFVFSIFNMDSSKYLDYRDFIAAARDSGLQTVPVLREDFVLIETLTIQDLVNYSIDKSVIHKEAWREGVVFRPLQETWDEELGRLSFKAINPEYLLKYGE